MPSLPGTCQALHDASLRRHVSGAHPSGVVPLAIAVDGDRERGSPIVALLGSIRHRGSEMSTSASACFVLCPRTNSGTEHSALTDHDRVGPQPPRPSPAALRL